MTDTRSAGAAVPTGAPPPSGAPARARPSLGGVIARWEVLLAAILCGTIAIGAAASPHFLTGGNFSNLIAALIEVGIMSLPMALIIILGEIDLSVEAMVGLSSAILGYLWAAGVPLWVAIPVVLCVGALGGMFNGILVTRIGLPSLVVTLGTLALFRGLALVVLGPLGISKFPAEFTAFGFGTVPGTPIPWPLLVYVGLALVLGVVLHRTWLGRQMYAIGQNNETSRYSGVRVARVRMALFILSGTVAALAGVILTARFASARADVGQGMTLTVVTIVLLGGVNIFGGRGTIPGVILAFLTLAVLGNVLRLTRVPTELQNIVGGLLLILSVAVTRIGHEGPSRLSGLRRGKAASTPPEVPT